ncbi:hypothetical protein CRE_09849 [Caenorhabditis remanei]|uniref:Uncharacterized protein n=1 Tax=Caenorhabditis remanei TaxID=31234 RepID=E3NJY8_CAERE|nr:hypothetical protein CRE_09849 [Caenorhabditis remanei]
MISVLHKITVLISMELARPTTPPLPRSVKNTKFPSDEELTYLRRCLKFKNLNALPQGVSLNNMAKVFDIFIRKMIQKAGGNLTSTKYRLNLRHPGYRATDGFWAMHQTYAVADGHFLCNTISNHMQSNTNISLDDAMTISMKIFERDKKAMAGRGRNVPEESLGSKVIKTFGIKWGLIADFFVTESNLIKSVDDLEHFIVPSKDAIAALEEKRASNK